MSVEKVEKYEKDEQIKKVRPMNTGRETSKCKAEIFLLGSPTSSVNKNLNSLKM